MAIYKNGNKIKKVFYKGTPVKEVYYYGQKVFPSAGSDEDIKITDDGKGIWISGRKPVQTETYGPSGGASGLEGLGSDITIPDISSSSFGDNWYYNSRLNEEKVSYPGGILKQPGHEYQLNTTNSYIYIDSASLVYNWGSKDISKEFTFTFCTISSLPSGTYDILIGLSYNDLNSSDRFILHRVYVEDEDGNIIQDWLDPAGTSSWSLSMYSKYLDNGKVYFFKAVYSCNFQSTWTNTRRFNTTVRVKLKKIDITSHYNEDMVLGVNKFKEVDEEGEVLFENISMSFTPLSEYDPSLPNASGVASMKVDENGDIYDLTLFA